MIDAAAGRRLPFLERVSFPRLPLRWGAVCDLPGLTDCHAHLADPVFDADRGEVLARARAKGVEAVVTVGETLGDAKRILELARTHAEILPAAGLYPTHLDLGQAEAMEAWIRENRDALVAIGEVGLDFWKVKEPQDR